MSLLTLFADEMRYDYYVNTSTGNDANNGTTPGTAKATVQAVKALFTAASGDKTVYVAPGTYKGGPYHNEGAGVYLSRRKITYYMAGVTVDNQDDAAGNFQNAAFNNADNLTVEVVGPCTMTNSANDILNADSNAAAGAEAILIARRVIASAPAAIGDGFSCHGVSKGYAYDCTFYADSNKSAIAHIDASRSYHYRCTVILVSGSGSQVKVAATAAGAPQAYFEDCIFKVQGANQVLLSVNDSGTNYGFARFTRCQFLKDGGTWNLAGANGTNSTAEFIDCYSDGWGTEANGQSVFRRCYGEWRILMGRGAGAGSVTIENCAFKTTLSEVLYWSAYNGTTHAGGAGGTIRNNIFIGATTAAIRSVTTAGAVDAINTLWSFQNNCFYTNTANYTTGLTADGVDVTAQDPLLVTGTGVTQTNWYVEEASPCVGAGTIGSDIGVGVA